MARNDGTYKKIQSKYANPILLIIDEWLLLKPTASEQHDILELLHRRRKKSSTIFCSQYDCKGWFDQLGGDDSPLAEELIRLRAENEYIKAENEVIKKRIALRQEKWAAQLKAKKQQSSKNSEKTDTN